MSTEKAILQSTTSKRYSKYHVYALMVIFIFFNACSRSQHHVVKCKQQHFKGGDSKSMNKMNTSNKFRMREKLQKYFKNMLFEFRGFPQTTISAYPLSLDKYFNDVTRANTTQSDLMKYEWARYGSFRYFPKTSLMMPTRLAQAGFYYTNLGEEVICFSCGVRNRNWNPNETAFLVHQRLSPNCAFIRGEDNKNIPIHGLETNDEASDTVRCQGGASGKLYEDTHSDEDQPCMKHRENATSSQRASTNDVPSIANPNQNLEVLGEFRPNNVAIETVMEMGYARQDIKDAIQTYQIFNGNTAPTVEEIIDVLLEGRSETTATNNGEPRSSGTRPAQNENRKRSCDTKEVVHSMKRLSLQPGTSSNQSTQHDLTAIVEENRCLRDQVNCKICMDNNACIVFMPCGHMVACAQCAPALRKCAICRKLIKNSIRVYPS